jgi:hypothetical protein
LAKVRKDVGALCKKFPLYSHRLKGR